MAFYNSRPSYTCLIFPGEPIRVLLIEPNERDRLFMTQTLVNLNYQVLALRDRTTILEAIAQFRPHFLLLDNRASQLQTPSFLPTLQQQYDWNYIPVQITAVISFLMDEGRSLPCC